MLFRLQSLFEIVKEADRQRSNVSQFGQRLWGVFVNIVVRATFTSIILLSANGLKRFLGKRGLIAMERLMGMLLIALAVQMLLEGISAYLAGIR